MPELPLSSAYKRVIIISLAWCRVAKRNSLEVFLKANEFDQTRHGFKAFVACFASRTLDGLLDGIGR